MMKKTEEKDVPKAVNWHCFKACNYACRFCYARFEDLMGTPPMTERDGCKLLDELAHQGVEKINFVGGEPMLHPHIRAWIVHAKSVGMVTSIVSNGTGIDREFLEAMSDHLDWVGLSIDASNDILHAQLGRGRKGEIKRGVSGHLRRTLPVADLLHEFGVGVKLNTVVTDLNKDDDMSQIVRRIRPHRWKIFQALRIDGENEEDIGELEVADRAFETYVERHQQALADLLETQVVAENNEAMLGTPYTAASVCSACVRNTVRTAASVILAAHSAWPIAGSHLSHRCARSSTCTIVGRGL